MKKSISVILTFLLLVLAVVYIPVSASADIATVKVIKNDTIRSKPANNGSKVQTAKKDSEYLYLKTEGNWYKVQVDGKTAGYLPKASCKLVQGVKVPVASSKKAFSQIALVLSKASNLKGFVKEYPETFRGKTAIAVYYDLGSDPAEISTVKLAADGIYRSIPEDLLATKISEADWALLIYPKVNYQADDPIQVKVLAVNVKKSAYYAPYCIEDRETVIENSGNSFDLRSVLSDIEDDTIYPRLEKKIRLATDEDYQAGLKYMKQGKYYSALASFENSDLEEAEAMAEKCVRAWPATGVIWLNSSLTGKNMSLTVKVNRNSKYATLIKIYKGSKLAACLFIRGTGKATAKLPAGTYTIKSGVGTTWYGRTEAFGPDGNYQTFTFGNDYSRKVKLSAGKWVLTVNASKSDPKGDDVGSEYENWGGF